MKNSTTIKQPAQPAAEADTAGDEVTPAQEPQPAQDSGSAPGDAPPTASAALDGKYTVVGTQPGRVATLTHGIVDLATISLAQAEELVATGKFPYLVRVE